MRSPPPASRSRSRPPACARRRASCTRRRTCCARCTAAASRSRSAPTATCRSDLGRDYEHALERGARLRLPHGLGVPRPRAARRAAWLSSASARPSTRTASCRACRSCSAASTIPHSHGLEGHSDADIVCHALCDALLGAACMDDIGTMFPSSDERWAGARSLDLLAEAWSRIAGERLGHRQRRRLRRAAGAAARALPRRDAGHVAGALQCEPGRVSVRATGTDGLGFTGRGEGAACQAVALLSAPSARRARRARRRRCRRPRSSRRP